MAAKEIELRFKPTGTQTTKAEIQSVGMSLDQVKKKIQELDKAGVDISKTSFRHYEGLGGKNIPGYGDRFSGGSGGGKATGIKYLAGQFATGKLTGQDVASFATGGSAVYGAAALAAVAVATKVTSSMISHRDAKTGKIEKWGVVDDFLTSEVPGYKLIKNIHELFTDNQFKIDKMLEGVKATEIKDEFVKGMKNAIRHTMNELEGVQLKGAFARNELGFGDQAFHRETAGILHSGYLEKYNLSKKAEEDQLAATEERNKKLGELANLKLTKDERSSQSQQIEKTYQDRIKSIQGNLSGQTADVDQTTQAKLQEQQRTADKAMTFFTRDQNEAYRQHWSALTTTSLQLMGYNRQAEVTAINEKYEEEITATSTKYDEMAKTVNAEQAKFLMGQKQFALNDIKNRREAEKQQAAQRRELEKQEEGRTGLVGENLLKLKMGNTMDRTARNQMAMQEEALSGFKSMQASADAVLKSKSATAAEKQEAFAQLQNYVGHFESHLADQNPLGERKLAGGAANTGTTGYYLAGKEWDSGTRRDYNKQLLGTNQAMKAQLGNIEKQLKEMLDFEKHAWERYNHDGM